MKSSKKLISLALALVMMLTPAIQASAYDTSGWYTQPTSPPSGIYDDPNGPSLVYVPDEYYSASIRENNMTSVSIHPRLLTLYGDLSRCTEIIYRGTASDLANHGLVFEEVPSREIPVKDESGEVLGWVGGDRRNIIGDWKLHNMVLRPDAGLDTAETVVIHDVVKHIASTTGAIREGITNPNMKRISLPKDFRSIDRGNHIEQCTEIIYRGTLDDLAATTITFQDFNYLDHTTTLPVPVKDESGRLFGFVGGWFGSEFNAKSVIERDPRPTDKLSGNRSRPVQDKSGQLLGYIWGRLAYPNDFPGYYEVDVPANSVTLVTDAAAPAVPSVPQTAIPANGKLTIDGAVKKPPTYNINGSNYIELRSLATALGNTDKKFFVEYNESFKAVVITTRATYIVMGADQAGTPAGNKTAELSRDKVYIDNELIPIEAYKIDGKNYFKLRDLAKALNFYVDWSPEQGVSINTYRPYFEG